MSYTIEPIYYLLPLVSLACAFLGIGNRKGVKVALAVAFVLIYSLSLNGSDLEGYREIYRRTGEGELLGSIHGEAGYYYLMKLSFILGFNYITFRAILLTVTSIVLFYSIAKLSQNFALSVFFVTTMFIVYTISAYRQYIVIAFSIFEIYQYGCGHKRRAIIGLIILLFFHITAILPLGCVIYHHLFRGQKTEKQVSFIKTHYVKLIILALALRVVMTIALSIGPIRAILASILSVHASPKTTLISFGLFSRLLFVIVVSYMYYRASEVEPTTRLIFWYYYISILLYIILPLEFVMGRLMNNASILVAVLIPVLRYDQDRREEQIGILQIRRISSVILITEMVALVVLTNQLLHQDGYTPYLNLLRGDKLLVTEEIEESSNEEQEEMEIEPENI